MNQMYERQFGYNIRTAREKRGMTQEALAAQLQIKGCDITRGALAKIEAGLRHVYPDEIRCIRECLFSDQNRPPARSGKGSGDWSPGQGFGG